MALSPTGLSLLDWDAAGALDAFLTEEGEESISAELCLPEATGEVSGPCVRRSSVCSPSSETGSTQSVDSGFVPQLVDGGVDDQLLLAGLFGEDFSDLFESRSSCSSASLSLAASSVPDSPGLANDDSPDGHHLVVPVSSSTSCQENMPMFGSDFDIDSPPSAPSTRADSKKSTSLSLQEKSRKNAEAARQNRLKKKKYVEDLERDRSKLRAENVVFKTRCSELQLKNRRLETEVAYLRSVLANQSTLSSLIRNIPGTPGVNLTSSLSHKRPSDSTDSLSHSSSATPPAAKKSKSESSGSELQHSGGVCLHVSKDSVSLEFCAQCSLKSTQV